MVSQLNARLLVPKVIVPPWPVSIRAFAMF
jgi:hypothetical protein